MSDHVWLNGECQKCWAREHWPLAELPCGVKTRRFDVRSPDEKAAIRRAYQAGESATVLAIRYGVSVRQIRRIVGKRGAK